MSRWVRFLEALYCGLLMAVAFLLVMWLGVALFGLGVR